MPLRLSVPKAFITLRAGVEPTRALAGAIFAGDSSTALLDASDRPEIRILSLTVTEHGYCLNRSTKQLDPDHALIRADLAHPERPSSAIGIIVEALRRRRDSGVAPFTALSCDNIQHNGNVLREAVLALQPGDSLDLLSTLHHLVRIGYTRADLVQQPGRARGDALDHSRHGCRQVGPWCARLPLCARWA